MKFISKVNLTSLAYLLLVGISIKLSLYPLFKDLSWWGHDTPAHLSRLYGTLNNLQLGQFPPYFDVDYTNFPGYAWNVFYPPLSTALLSLVHSLTDDYNLTMKVTSGVIVLLTFLTSASFFKTQVQCRGKAMLYALAFSLCLYTSDNLFVRAALPESLAIAFLPLVFQGLVLKEQKSSMFYLTLGIALIVLTNIPSSIMLLLFLLMYCGVHGFPFTKIKQIVLAYVFAGCLSAFFLLPFVYSIHGASFEVLDLNYFELMRETTVSLDHFLTGRVIKNNVALYNMILGVGLPLSCLLIFSLWRTKTWQQANVVLILILSFLITTPIDFSFLPDTFTLFAKIQFAWRLIPLVVFIMLWQISTDSHVKSVHVLATIVLTSLIATSITVPQGGGDNLERRQIEFITHDNDDYVLSQAGAKRADISLEQLSCHVDSGHGVSMTDTNIEKIHFDRQLSEQGLPIFSFQLTHPAKCTIPFLAYNPVTLKGVKKFTPKGFFEAELDAGHHQITVEIKPYFRFLVYFSLAFSMLSWVCFLVMRYRTVTRVR